MSDELETTVADIEILSSDFDEILAMLKEETLMRNARMSNFRPHSALTTLYEVMALLYAIIRGFQRKAEDNNFVMTATGAYLDRLIKDRLPLGRIEGTYSEGIVVFSRESVGYDVDIPAGTRVGSLSQAGSVIFKTDADATMSGEQSSVSVNVTSENMGESTNVGIGYINNMIDAIPGVDNVYNYVETTGGSDEESDEDLAKRYANSFLIVSAAIPEAIENGVETLDGVAECQITTLYPGVICVVVANATYDELVSSMLLEKLGAGTIAAGIELLRLTNGSVYYVPDAYCVGAHPYLVNTDYSTAIRRLFAVVKLQDDTYKMAIYVLPANTVPWEFTLPSEINWNTPMALAATDLDISRDGQNVLFAADAGYIKKYSSGSWVSITSSAHQSKIAAKSATYIAAALDGYLWIWSANTWTQVDSVVEISEVAITASGQIFGIRASDSVLLQWTGSAWASKTVVMHGISAINNYVYGIVSDKLWMYSVASSAFGVVESVTAVSSVSVSIDGIVTAISTDGKVLCLIGTGFVEVETPSTEPTKIVHGTVNSMAILDANYDVIASNIDTQLTDLVTRVPMAKTPDSLSGYLFVGLGVPKLLWNMPDHIDVTISIGMTFTDSPEDNLKGLIAKSIFDMLDDFETGQNMKWSKTFQFVLQQYVSKTEVGRAFIGIESISSLEISIPGQTINSTDGEITVRDYWKLRPKQVSINGDLILEDN